MVRPAARPDRYELVMGERRWRAAREAGLDRIPAIVRDTADDALLRDALLENLHRAQLNPLEEAAAYDQLLNDFGCTHEELAHADRPVPLAGLQHAAAAATSRRACSAGSPPESCRPGTPAPCSASTDAEEQERLAHRIVAEGLSVRAVEEIVTVGDESTTARRARTSAHKPVAPGLADLAERLSDRLETRVRVDLGRTKGRITIDFASLDDLNRIVGVLDPPS